VGGPIPDLCCLNEPTHENETLWRSFVKTLEPKRSR